MSSKFVDMTSIMQVIGCVYNQPQLLDYTDKYSITDEDFANDFCEDLINKLSLKGDTDIESVDGVSIRKRGDVIFVMNFADETRKVTLDKEYVNVVTGEKVDGEVELDVCGYIILIRNS